ncbi:MAG: TetR family transcriptional regulator [Polaromonas sp.]|uniref:TetR family transcriptional regulator n=1 Tax=Polaromonas sp. TaxID=1869339 RepID=UPI0025F323F2|nr:TetR family transcriptional regulator [Polaromonas sp.]MBI2727100.1 TetR family transcriptional regulator [Polaromonas sp.]
MSKEENIEEVLRCAQALFSKRGYDSIALREIADAAHLSLGTVSFYFKAKEDIFQTLVQRAVRTIGTERLALLAQSPRQGFTPLEHILFAIIWPVLRRLEDPNPIEQSIPRLIRWALTGPERVEQSLRKEFDATAADLIRTVQIACPQLSRTRAIWAYSFTISMLYSRQVFDNRYADLMEDQTTDRSLEDRAMLLVRFASAGFLGLRSGGES